MGIRSLRRLAGAVCTAACAAALAGCATTAADPRDPIEPVNRVVFEFNDQVDRFAVKPIAEAYSAVTPEIVRTGVRNFFANLRDPWIGVNNLLQGKVEEGLSDFFRFITNSTFGLAGFTDIASDMGMQKHNEDFGQTLGRWGIADGAYLVLPILGPSSARDAVGTVADAYAYAPFWVPAAFDFNHRVAWRNGLTILDTINIRANLLGTTGLLEEAALDRYVFVRNAYLQRRRNLVWDGNPPPERQGKSGTPPVSLEMEPTREPPALSWVQSPPYAAVRLQVVEPKVPANYQAVVAATRPAVVANVR
jgi:phospholipid-binding lipoprotein MlaA